MEPWRERLHQLCEGIEIASLGSLNESSLHGRHRFGAKDVFALSYSKELQQLWPIPLSVGDMAAPEPRMPAPKHYVRSPGRSPTDPGEPGRLYGRAAMISERAGSDAATSQTTSPLA